jgi:serine/threonine protein kinase
MADFMVQYFRGLLPAIESSQVSTDACIECWRVIENALHQGGQNLQSIVEAKTRKLRSVLLTSAARNTSCSAPSLFIRQNSVLPDEIQYPIVNSFSIGSALDFELAVRICLKFPRGCFGTVHFVRIRSKFFGAKYYQYEEGSEALDNKFTDVLTAFSRVDRRCLADVLYYQKPVRGRGPIVAWQWLSSSSLAGLLNRVRRGAQIAFWTSSTRVIIICGIACGLLSLHSRNLFHGSLKPTDILLDSDHNVHLTDYMSFSLERLGLVFSFVVDSPIYDAPEVYTLDDEPLHIGDRDDAKKFMPIDVYSFGLISYEILSLMSVFSPTLSRAELLRKTKNNLERPQIPSCIKGDFRKLIERCWNSDPSKRPPIGEVWHTLERMNFQITDGVDSDLVRQRIAAFRPMDSQPVATCTKNGEESLKFPSKENVVSVSQDSATDTKLGTVVSDRKVAPDKVPQQSRPSASSSEALASDTKHRCGGSHFNVKTAAEKEHDTSHRGDGH